MGQTLRFLVTPEQAGRPLRSLLREKGLSQTMTRRVKRWPDGITVDGVAVHTDFCAAAGACVAVKLEREGQERLVAERFDGPLNLRYEDENMLIVHKPAGLSVHSSPGHRADSLGARVLAYFDGKGEVRPFRPVGRLDCDTSGLCIIAKNSFTQTSLEKQRKTGAYKRIYYAICIGKVEPEEGTLAWPVLSSPRQLKREISPEGQTAVTHYRRIFFGNGLSLVRVTIETGRTHQIRVHMSYLGYPLAGDFLYGTEEPKLIERHALHSGKLVFIHPISGDAMSFCEPLPQDMRCLCGRMGISNIHLEKSDEFLLKGNIHV